MPSISPYYTQFAKTSGINQELNLVPTTTIMGLGSAWSLSQWNSSQVVYEGGFPPSNYMSYSYITSNFDAYGHFVWGTNNILLSEYSDLVILGGGNDQVVIKNDVWTPWGGYDVIFGGYRGADKLVFMSGNQSTYNFSYGSDSAGNYVVVSLPGSVGNIKAYDFEQAFFSVNQSTVYLTTPTISFTSATASINEGNSGIQPVTVTASLSSAATIAVTVPITYSGSATAYTDYRGLIDSITIDAGSTTGSLTFIIVGDTTVESNETAVLTMGTPTGATLGANTTFTQTIVNDDIAPLPTISFDTTTASINEGNSGTQTVTATASLSSAATTAITVPITYSGSATVGSDYTAGSSTITFAAGSTTASTSFSVLGDIYDESNETVVLTLGTPTGATLGANTTFTETIVNDDVSLYDKIISIYPELSTYSFANGTITLQNDSNGLGDYIQTWNHPTLPRPTDAQLANYLTVAPFIVGSNPVDAATNVPVSTNFVVNLNEPAVFGTGVLNLLNDSGQVFYSINAGDTSQLTLTGNQLIINPQYDLPNSTHFNVTFSADFLRDSVGNQSSAFTGYDFTTAAPNLPTVSFTSTTASINEGNSGTQAVTATASLSSAATIAVTVPITFSGTATAGTDYTGAPSSINIAAGSTTGSASFNIEGDIAVESNETVVLTMGTPTGATLGANTTFTQTIVNDDVATNSYSPGQSIIDLGSYGKLIAPVQVDGGNWYYFWDRSGDGTSTDGVNGVADKTTHDVLDAIFNRDALGNLGSGNTTDAYRYATLNGVQLALPTSGTTTAIDTFKNGTSISGGSSAVNSTYNDLLAVWDAFNGSGTGPTSNGAAGTPTGWAAIANNNGSHYWSATPQGTADYHSTVTLWSGYYGGGPDTLSFNVALQVLPLALTPTVSFTTTTASINEGNSGTQTVTATANLSSAATIAVTVPITYSGTATAGTDYSGAPASITIAAGSTSGSASFSIVGDTTVESNETVVLTMGTPTGATLGTNTTFTETIVNDDVPTVSFTTTTASISEGNSGTQNVTVNASLSSAATTAVTVPITVSGSATAGTDYTGAPASITIAAGSTTGSASFSVLGDATVESNETVVLTMGTPTGATLGTNTSFTQTIVNDDVALPTIQITPSSQSVNEGTSITLNLLTSNLSDGTLISYSFSGQGITSSDIASGRLSGTTTVVNNAASFSIDLAADSKTEGAEALSVSVSTSLDLNTVVKPSYSFAGELFTYKAGNQFWYNGQQNTVENYLLSLDGTSHSSFVVWNKSDNSVGWSGIAEPFSWFGSLGSLISVVDLNGDGNQDFLGRDASGQVVSFIMNGQWAPSDPLPNPIQSGISVNLLADNTVNSILASIDVDGDNNVDLILGSATGLLIAKGNGDGTFTDNDATVNLGYSALPSWGVKVLGGHFNADENLDLVVSTGGKVNVLLGNGQGGFNSSFISTPNHYLPPVAVGDLNGDNISDLLINKQVFIGNGLGGFTSGSEISISPGRTVNDVIFTDINADGFQDVVMALDLNGIVTATGYGNGVFNTPISFGNNLGTLDNLIAIDFNGDKKLDIAASGNGTGTYIFENTSLIASAQIVVNDISKSVISFTTTTASISEGNSGTQNVTVNASLSSAATTAVTVPITVSGSATAGTDYTGAPTSITIAAGSTTGSASFNIVGDTTIESNETVVLTMGTPTGATLGTNATFTQTIIDDEPTYSLTANLASIYEGGGGDGSAVYYMGPQVPAAPLSQITFTIATTNVAANTPLTYALSGAGITSADLGGAALAGTVLVGTDGRATITVNPSRDFSAEGIETLMATVQGQSASVQINDYAPAYRLQAFSMGGVPSISGVGRLSDGASIPLAPDNTDYANYLRWLADGNTPYAALAPNSWSVDEGGTASFTVLTQNVAANTVFNYTLSGSAISASDIVGGAMSGPVTIGSDGKGTFTVNIASDLSTEGPETLMASIGTNSNAAYVTINDSSTRPLPTYSLSASAGSFNEGSAVTFSLVTTNVDANTTLTYNLSGSGISVNDFVIPSLTGNVTIDQYGRGSFTVNLANDLMTEGSEILSASVQGQSTSVFIMDTSVAAPVLPTVSFTTTTASINEGNSGTQNVTVNASLSSAATTAVTVPITYSGSATVGSDYTAGSGTITFAAGSTTASTSFSVLGDIYDESNETVVLTMGTPTGATLGASSTYTHTILNDDVTLATTSGRVIDGYVAGAKVFADLDNDLVLDWSDANGNAIYDNGEGEPWALTDVQGVYSFTSSANISNAKIVSIGGTDVSTHAAMDLLLAAPGSSYITPISTIYAYAEAQGQGKGAAVLSSLGLSTADLSYDPVASLASNPNAAQVLKIGVSLLTVVNNASALVTELSPSAVSQSTAAANVFAQIANLGSYSLGNLVSSDPAVASSALNAVLTSSLSMQGVNLTNYGSLISATATAVANVTSQVQSLTSAEVQAGAQNALGALGQTTLADHIQTIADLASSGSALAATQIASLGTTYAAGNIDNLVIAEEFKLASAPTISLATHVNPTTGAITVDAGWTGSLESINYSVRAVGASFSSSSTDTLPGDWSALEGHANVGQSSQSNIGVIGSSPNSITGDGSFSQTVFTPNAGVRDVTISMLDVAVDPVGNQDDLPVDIPAVVTLAMGATLSVAGTPNLNVTEGSNNAAQTVTINVALDRPILTNQTLSWSVAGNAINGTDAVSGTDFVGGALPTGTLTLLAGATTGQITFQIAGDNAIERTEGYQIMLSGSSGLDLSGIAPLTGTIANDDRAVISISALSAQAVEGDTGSTPYQMTVTLDQASFESQTVDWATEFVSGQGRASALDFALGSALSGSVTFAAGETSKTITLNVAGDTIKEGNESFSVRLSNSIGDATISAASGVLNAIIKDDDGFDVGGHVYFWGGGVASKQFVMDDVDVSVQQLGNSVQTLIDAPIQLQNIKLNTDSHLATADLWASHTDMSSFSFTSSLPAGAVFTNSLSSSWSVVQSVDAQGILHVSANYTGAANTQTLDTMKIGVVTFTTPEEDASPLSFKLLDGSVSNDAGLSKTISPVEAKIIFADTTDVTAPGDILDGQYTLGTLTEGIYGIDADRDFILSTKDANGFDIWSNEVKAITAADARECLLISLGKQVSGHELIAADVNGSGSVTSADARDILLMSIKNTAKLTTELEWKFVDEDANLSALTKNNVKEGVAWKQGADISVTSDSSHNLVGILMGDLNASYTPDYAKVTPDQAHIW